MTKYIEEWSEGFGHITGYKKVEDDYEITENEVWATSDSYFQNWKKFEQKKSRYNNTLVMSSLAMNKRREATEALVNIIKSNYIIKTTRNDEHPEMWVYKEGIYVPEAKTLIAETCREVLGEAHTTQLINEVIAKIQADTYVNEQEFFNEQNKDPYLLPVKNGLLDLRNKELQLFTHEIAYFNKINADYKPGADCPEIKKFLREVLGSKEDYLVIQELLGFCLIRDYKFEKAFMFYGSHGRNGKSKLLELIARFIGTDNISGVSLQDIEKDDFAIANLQNKLVNIAGDISNEAIKNTGKFKALTGRDTISANRKFKTRIDFINYAKIIFACNELPPVYTLSDSFWLRWVLVDFPYQFLPEKEIKALQEADKIHVKAQDAAIIDRLSTEEEHNGLLNFALEGLARLEEQRDFSNTQTAKELRIDWQRKSNSVAAFIQDHIEEAWNSEILKSDFLKEYTRYCDYYRLKQVSDIVIKTTLKEMGISEGRPTIEGVQVRVWQGIRFKFSQGCQGRQGFLPLCKNPIFPIGKKTEAISDTLAISDEVVE